MAYPRRAGQALGSGSMTPGQMRVPAGTGGQATAEQLLAAFDALNEAQRGADERRARGVINALIDMTAPKAKPPAPGTGGRPPVVPPPPGGSAPPSLTPPFRPGLPGSPLGAPAIPTALPKGMYAPAIANNLMRAMRFANPAGLAAVAGYWLYPWVFPDQQPRDLIMPAGNWTQSAPCASPVPRGPVNTWANCASAEGCPVSGVPVGCFPGGAPSSSMESVIVPRMLTIPTRWRFTTGWSNGAGIPGGLTFDRWFNYALQQPTNPGTGLLRLRAVNQGFQQAPTPWPMLNPLSIPPLSPGQVPGPIPWKYIPHRNPSEERSPDEQTTRGPKPDPKPEPKVEPKTPPLKPYEKPSFDIVVDGRAGRKGPPRRTWRYGIHKMQPPRKRQKERKFLAPRRTALALMGALGVLTEFDDFVDVLFGALSPAAQAGWDGGNAFDKLAYALTHLDQLNVGKFIADFIANELEDSAIGRLNRNAQRASRARAKSGYGINRTGYGDTLPGRPDGPGSLSTGDPYLEAVNSWLESL